MALALYCDNVVATIRKDYPLAAQLLTDADSKYETLSVLKAAKVITPYTMDTKTFQIYHAGTDNTITWSEYGTKIEQHLKDNNEYKMYPKLLEPAVKSLAKYIHEAHYEDYPCWPSVGESNPAEYEGYWHDIEVDKFDDHEVGEFYVAWACGGILQVRDERPAQKKYIAKFKSQPKLQVLFCNRKKLKELEDNTERYGIKYMKSDIKRVYKQKDLKPISWSSSALFD